MGTRAPGGFTFDVAIMCNSLNPFLQARVPLEPEFPQGRVLYQKAGWQNMVAKFGKKVHFFLLWDIGAAHQGPGGQETTAADARGRQAGCCQRSPGLAVPRGRQASC